MQLLGKNVGDVLWEIFGPITGKNKFLAESPSTLEIQVFGTGEVTVESNQDFIFGSHSPTDPNPALVIMADPDGWSAVGVPIDASDGLTTVTITATTDIQYVRVRVSGTGTGKVKMAARWF